jgi:acetyl-CoA acetyltransferase
MPATRADKLLQDPDVQYVITLLRQAVNHAAKFEVTRENLTLMLLESHRKAATATEEIAAVREIGKLNGLYEQKITVTNEHVTKIEQLEGLSTEELLRRSQLQLDSLAAEDADFEEVPTHE